MGPDEMWIPLVAIFVTIGGPILLVLISTLLKHQRYMMESMRQIPQNESDIAKDLSQMKEDIKELKEVMLSHTLSLDTNIDGMRRKLEEVERQKDRL